MGRAEEKSPKIPRGDRAKETESIHHFKERVAAGENWYIALLETMGLWTLPEEEYQGQYYRYLIGGEAFDWLLLAKRLCDTLDGFIPAEDREKLFALGEPPIEISKEQFRNLIGSAKYRAYLNYWYGIKVEEALIQAVEEEVRKEGMASGRKLRGDLSEEVYKRIYDTPQGSLLQQFRLEKNYHKTKSLSDADLKEFIYWLFKYRLRQCDKARIASDTKKGLNRLQAQRGHPPSGLPLRDSSDTIEIRPDLPYW